MRKALKWIGVTLGALIALFLAATAVLYAQARSQFTRTYTVPVESIVSSSGTPSVEHGKHLAGFLCTECHGDDLAGTPKWLVLPGLAAVSPPNLTPGSGSQTRDLTMQDWVRLLHHGVKPDGTSVFLMPSNFFYYLSDSDLRDLLAYIQSLPPIDRGTDGQQNVHLTYVGTALYAAGVFGHQLRAQTIDHTTRPASFPPPGLTPAYGEYLLNINGCRACHGPQLSGGKPSNPNSPLAPNLTPAGELSVWTAADFLKAIRTGVTPSGRHLDPQFMPWPYKAKMSDDELQAILLYLQSLPKLPTTTAPAE